MNVRESKVLMFEISKSFIMARANPDSLPYIIFTVAPRIGGTTAPPLTPAIISPDPRFVCLPIPRIPNATMVGKQTLSKKSVRLSMAMPVFCFWIVEVALNIITQVR